MKRALALLLLCGASGSAWGQAAVPASPVALSVEAPSGNAAVALLVRQGQRWLDENRPDLATSAVERALSAEPHNGDALLLGVKIEIARNNRSAANAYAARLRNAGATPEQQAAANGALRAASIDPLALASARGLAREHHSEEAAARYQALFGPGDPPQAYAREYYQVLASADSTRALGERGLARLAALPDADDSTLLAHAQSLGYTAATRADAISRLAKLADSRTVGGQAQAAWKQTLGFYGQDPAVVPLLQAYLRRFPNDPEITQQLGAVRISKPADPADAMRQSAFTALDAGRVGAAEQQFTEALATSPNDADALGGLGIVRLRQNRAAEAKDLLQRAIAADPARSTQWKKALDGSEYSLELADARARLRRGDIAGAETELRRAVRRDVEDSSDAESMLGEVALKRGDASEAEQHFRAALARRPGFAPSTNGLYQALRAQGRYAEIPRGAVPSPGTATAGRGPNNQASDAARAEAARSPDPTTQIELLSNAMTLAPDDPWLRLDLARVLRKVGRNAEARALMEDAAARHPGPDTAYASALLAQEDGRPADALALLSRIRPALMTPDMARLQARVRTQDDVAHNAALLPSAPAEARQRLLALATRPDPTGDTAADVIHALGGAGDRVGAAEAGHLAATVNREPSAQIAIAGALLAAGLDADATVIAGRLDLTRLSGAQQRDVATLRTNTAVRLSDKLNERGKQAEAFEQLRPALTSNPDSPDVQLALARLYQSAHNPAEASRIALKVLERNPRDADARRGAVEAAIAGNDWPRAQALADEGVALAPGNSRAILLQADVARASGNNARARTLLAQAATAREAELGTPSDTRVGETQAAANPFSGNGATAAVGTGVPQDPVAQTIAKEQASLAADTASHVSGSIVVRSRSGQAGLDQLQDVSAPVEVNFEPTGISGRVTATVTPVLLDAGTLSGSGDALRFGTNAASGTALVPQSKSVTGAAIKVGYQRDIFSIEAGSSPLGFPVSNAVGSVELAPKLSSRITLRLRVERSSVLDSMLSYAGLHDPVSGTTWGGVTQTGFHGQIEAGVGEGYVYAGGGYAVYDGTHVKRNTKEEISSGFGYPIYKQDNTELTSGLNAIYFRFDNNQRGFTLGQGGYFSPQSFVSLSVPVDYRSRWNDLRYHVGGSLGYANFREEGSALYPIDPALESSAIAAAAVNPLVPTTNQGQSKSGFVGGVRIDLSYPLTDTLELAGAFTYDKAAQWEESKVSVRLQQRF